MLQISHGEGEEESDIFTIREVSFQAEGDPDWKETSYTLSTDSLDWVRAEPKHKVSKRSNRCRLVIPVLLLRRCTTT